MQREAITDQPTPAPPDSPRRPRGLTSAEVAERVARGESNNYQPRVGRTYWQIIRENIFNIFNLILFPLLGVIVSFGEYAVAFFAGFSVVTNALLGTIQEIIAKRRLDRLAALAEQQVQVYRDGALTRVPMRQLVKDDVIPIAPGDRLVVDGRVLEADALEMDESHLTGESDSVLKEVGDEVHSGSFCLAGTGVMVATRVGRESTINQLATAAKTYKNPLTPTQRRILAIVEISIIIMLICGPMLWFANTITGVTLLEKVKNLVVFVTSIVPYGLVLIVIISLSLGAITISRHRTLVRRVNAVESMANVTVLCFDKTGTLTQNKLAVTEVRTINDESLSAVRAKLRAYTANLAHLNGTAAAVAKYVADVSPPPVTKVREIPFTSARKWSALVLPDETLILGAPERVLHLNQPGGEESALQAATLARNGLRVLAFARAAATAADDHIEIARATPLALIVLSDQVRPNIEETLAALRAQNVRLKVISGDNLETVKAIAGQAGMDVAEAYTGDELEAMSASEFEAAARNGTVFARVEPDTKRRLVAALRRSGEHVAMVGDGVNDVPALKEADLAVVMNDGAQITKEIGDIVLLDNAMSTLPRALKEGTEITQTIFGTVKIFLVKAFYNVLLFIFAGFMALPFPITPIQINWITFGTVNIAATLVAFKVLRPARMRQFRRDVLEYVLAGAVLASAALALLCAVTYVASDGSTAAMRTAVSLFVTLFGVLVLWNVFGVDLLRPRTILENRGTFLIGFGLMVMTLLGFYIAPDLLEFVQPDPLTILLITAVYLLVIVLYSVGMRDRRLFHALWTLTES
ncbi:MAG: HAD-IC family P-type ATPase [Aggregatilineales bacterium]